MRSSRSISISYSRQPSLQGCIVNEMQIIDQTNRMKPTAPWRNKLRVFSTTPCRGLSFSLDDKSIWRYFYEH